MAYDRERFVDVISEYLIRGRAYFHMYRLVQKNRAGFTCRYEAFLEAMELVKKTELIAKSLDRENGSGYGDEYVSGFVDGDGSGYGDGDGDGYGTGYGNGPGYGYESPEDVVSKKVSKLMVMI